MRQAPWMCRVSSCWTKSSRFRRAFASCRRRPALWVMHVAMPTMCLRPGSTPPGEQGHLYTADYAPRGFAVLPATARACVHTGLGVAILNHYTGLEGQCMPNLACGSACFHASRFSELASRYKTRLCSFGRSCNRPICFFAHTAEELRCVPNADDGGCRVKRQLTCSLPACGAPFISWTPCLLPIPQARSLMSASTCCS
jgi:hypothetical protein